MADTTSVLKGSFEDSLGRKLHPDTDAERVAMADGKSLEAKVAELLSMFSGYLPLSGGGTVSGRINVDNGRIDVSQWASLSAGSDGFVLLGHNCYKHPTNNKYYYRNTHDNLGAKGIVFRYGGNSGLAWFDTGLIATTADTEFTPDIKSLTTPDAELISGQDLNAITKNGSYCGEKLGNAPDVDWWYVWTQNLTNNSASYVCQIASGVNRMAMYFRIKLNGSWLGWSQLLTESGGTISGTLNVTGSLQVRGASVPAQYISAQAPSSSQGSDGDTWDVYV